MSVPGVLSSAVLYVVMFIVPGTACLSNPLLSKYTQLASALIWGFFPL
jgi:hypothetical protein